MLLNAKITHPGVPTTIVDRPRLYRRLDGWRDVRGIVIQAPAGYGKSSLASRWLDVTGPGAQAAWVSLDESDADPIQFVHYVAAALERVYPGVSALVQPILDDSRDNAARALVRLLSALPDMRPATHADQHVLLVLDDYHRAHAPDVDALILTMLERGPATLHLMLLVRLRTELPLARLYAQNKITALTAADLRFTEKEIGQYLEHQGFGEPSRSVTAQLTARSEGWVTALQLARLAQQRPGDVAGLIDMLQGDREWLADFLADEVLKRQTPARQDFLLQISILDEFNAPLCAAVTGDPMAFAHLADLVRADVFLIRLCDAGDNNGGWYRFHHLFQEMLQQRLNAQTYAGNRAEYHRRAAQWLADDGRVADAVRHFLAAGDESAAAALVEARMATVITRSPYEAKHLFGMLPQPVIERRPRLMLDRCFLALEFDDRLVLAYVEQAERTLAQLGLSPSDAPSMHAELLVCRGGAHLLLGEMDRVHQCTAAAMQVIAQLPYHSTGTLHFLIMHQYHHLGDHAAVERHGTQALALFTQADFTFGIVALRRRIARWSMDRGEQRTAAARFRTICADPAGQRPEALRELFFTYVYAAEERYWADDLVQARAYQQDAGELAVQLQDDELMLLTQRMQDCYDRNSPSTAAPQVHPAIPLNRILSRSTFNLLLDLETRHLKGPDDHAAAWEAIQPYGTDGPASAKDTEGDALIPCLRTYIGRGAELAQVTTRLADALTRHTEIGLRFRQLQVLVLTAWQQLQLNGIDAAAGHLLAAVQLAQETGYVRVLLDIPPVMTALNELGLRWPLPSEDGEGAAGAQKPVNLTPREQAVLTRLAREESYTQIAAALVISVNTVRTHVRHLYRKLGVRRREQAIIRATIDGLLPMPTGPSPRGDED